jgi:hypothetical protein
MISSLSSFYWGAGFEGQSSFRAEARAKIEPLIHSDDLKDRRLAVKMLSLVVRK